ncbi:unnamed protein product [Allacma fusca]|uniref:TM2 domain-containing protein n=1 Tax=Allacma fusca TaxID=39272 RepID=A0A8J2LNL4_9HEXA|nr:unnamed protein product [Allacma fusca]
MQDGICKALLPGTHFSLYNPWTALIVMEIKLNLQYVFKIFIFWILTSFPDANTKENEKFGSSVSKAHHSDSNLGSKGDKMNGLSKDLRQPHHHLPPASDLRVPPNIRHIHSPDCNNDQADTECSDTGGDCINCNFDEVANYCEYGENVLMSCNVSQNVVCKGDRSFSKTISCQYCYQTPLTQQICGGYTTCNAAPRNYFKANCTVLPNVLCLGNRSFSRNLPCNWKNGYRWSTAFLLSVTLGGFGADRFYLGRWQEGIGKLFSFGGLGLWTIVDIILIGVRYLGPADGSLFVD